jgi:hypothetical protein
MISGSTGGSTKEVDLDDAFVRPNLCSEIPSVFFPHSTLKPTGARN